MTERVSGVATGQNGPNDGGTADELLVVDDLRTYFDVMDGTVKAVDGVSFSLPRGGSIGIVGESGSGKSVTALTVMQLLEVPPAKIPSGSITLEGRELLAFTDDQMRRVRGGEIAMIFQEPMTSLNPVFTIGYQISEAVREHLDVGKSEANERAVAALAQVGMNSPERRVKQYPHELSGGMRQRAMIAMGLSCQPKMLIADEPTTALDVTVQAQILDLIRASQAELGMALMLITHDLGVVAEMVDHVAVMYGGRIVETGPVERSSPPHDTRTLRGCSSRCPHARVAASDSASSRVPSPIPSTCPRAATSLPAARLASRRVAHMIPSCGTSMGQWMRISLAGCTASRHRRPRLPPGRPRLPPGRPRLPPRRPRLAKYRPMGRPAHDTLCVNPRPRPRGSEPRAVAPRHGELGRRRPHRASNGR